MPNLPVKRTMYVIIRSQGGYYKKQPKCKTCKYAPEKYVSETHIEPRLVRIVMEDEENLICQDVFGQTKHCSDEALLVRIPKNDPGLYPNEFLARQAIKRKAIPYNADGSESIEEIYKGYKKIKK